MVLMRIKCLVAGMTERYQILEMGMPSPLPWPYVVNMQFHVLIGGWRTAANAASSAIPVEHFHTELRSWRILRGVLWEQPQRNEGTSVAGNADCRLESHCPESIAQVILNYALLNEGALPPI